MKTRIRATAVLVCLPAVMACCLLLSPTIATAGAVAPLPASDYTVRHACAARPLPATPAAWRRSSCPRPRPRVHACTRWAWCARPRSPRRPRRKAPTACGPKTYATPTSRAKQPDAPASEPQTIALIEAYNDLDAEADLNTYSHEFGIPELAPCTTGETSDCFEQVNEQGSTETKELPFPQTLGEEKAARKLCEERPTESEPIEEWEEKEAACAEVEEATGWSLETSLDIEIAHATCQNCRIVIVEAENPSYDALEEAEETAAKPASSGESAPPRSPTHGTALNPNRETVEPKRWTAPPSTTPAS